MAECRSKELGGFVLEEIRHDDGLFLVGVLNLWILRVLDALEFVVLDLSHVTNRFLKSKQVAAIVMNINSRHLLNKTAFELRLSLGGLEVTLFYNLSQVKTWHLLLGISLARRGVMMNTWRIGMLASSIRKRLLSKTVRYEELVCHFDHTWSILCLHVSISHSLLLLDDCWLLLLSCISSLPCLDVGHWPLFGKLTDNSFCLR